MKKLINFLKKSTVTAVLFLTFFNTITPLTNSITPDYGVSTCVADEPVKDQRPLGSGGAEHD